MAERRVKRRRGDRQQASSPKPREQFGKGAARKLRAIGKVPAVLYGHGTEPQHVSLPGHETALILRRANAIIDLDIAGKSQLALVKDVQKDPVRQIIEHIDLIIVATGEKVHVDVAVHVVGEPAPAWRSTWTPRCCSSRRSPRASRSASRSTSRASRPAPRFSRRMSCCRRLDPHHRPGHAGRRGQRPGRAGPRRGA